MVGIPGNPCPRVKSLRREPPTVQPFEKSPYGSLREPCFPPKNGFRSSNSVIFQLFLSVTKNWLKNGKKEKQLNPIGSICMLYMVCHGSHQYTPVMLALIYQHHGSVMGIEVSTGWIIRWPPKTSDLHRTLSLAHTMSGASWRRCGVRFFVLHESGKHGHIGSPWCWNIYKTGWFWTRANVGIHIPAPWWANMGQKGNEILMILLALFEAIKFDAAQFNTGERGPFPSRRQTFHKSHGHFQNCTQKSSRFGPCCKGEKVFRLRAATSIIPIWPWGPGCWFPKVGFSTRNPNGAPYWFNIAMENVHVYRWLTFPGPFCRGKLLDVQHPFDIPL